MLSKNIKTGAEMIFGSVISSPDWMLVEKKAEPKAPKEAPTKEPPKAEPEKATGKKSTSAPKKRTRK